MKLFAIIAGVCLSWPAWPAAFAAEELLPPTPEPGPAVEARDLITDLRLSPAPHELQSGEGLTTKRGAPDSPTLFREVPSINGQYSVGGTTLLPFIGAGFGGGYSSDRDRALNPGVSGLSDSGLRSQWNQMGQGFAPNEFHMGIRIPF